MRLVSASPGPWLTDEQQRVWRLFLRMNSELNERIERDLQATAGMPHAYFVILVRLSEAPDRSLRMNQLAVQADASQSRLSHAVARLEERGWVVRTRSSSDRRGQVATLTDDGLQALRHTAPQHATTVRSLMFDPLDDRDLHEWGRLLQTILDRMEQSA
jgi:DNA-binding MarR family transcriptional regulator